MFPDMFLLLLTIDRFYLNFYLEKVGSDSNFYIKWQKQDGMMSCLGNVSLIFKDQSLYLSFPFFHINY